MRSPHTVSLQEPRQIAQQPSVVDRFDLGDLALAHVTKAIALGIRVGDLALRDCLSGSSTVLGPRKR